MRPHFKPALEPLEDRATPANIRAVSASLESPTTVRLTYQANGTTAFIVGVYRSADAVLSDDDVLVGASIAAPGAKRGSQTADVALAAEMPIDPERPHVLVVADPGNAVAEAKENDNVARFRKLALAVVTHGLQLDGALPAWLGELAGDLRDAGFDRVVTYDWAAASIALQPGTAAAAGGGMAQKVRNAVAQLANKPGDVVDVQFVGHSRGTVVVSQALQNLASVPGSKALRNGYVRMTLLDPHPAANRGSVAFGTAELTNGTGVSTVGGFSFDPANQTSVLAAQTVLTFQSVVLDPRVVVPGNVDRAEVFYQRLPWDQTADGGFESDFGLNLWGERPTDINNLSGRALVSVDVSATPTGRNVGHTEVQTWYIANLGTYLPL